jgi:hypothetical protein
MNYIIESLFVGLYTCIIYLIFSPFIKNFSVLLLVCGFFKHLFGSIFGLWNWYCNNGDACLKVLNQDQQYKSNTIYLLTDSIVESILFLIVGSLLSLIIQSGLLLFFTMGIILHILSELFGIHKNFCKKTCDKIDRN